MARRRPTHAISMFPFLAVLVCTMGALILLLLVTTRRIRNDLQQQTAVQVADGSQPAQRCPIAGSVDATAEQSPPDVAAAEDRKAADVASAADPEPQTGADPDSDDDDVKARAAAVADIHRRHAQIAQLKHDISVAEDRQQKLNAEIQQLRQRRERQQQRHEEQKLLQLELARLEHDYDAMSAVLDDQRNLLQQAEAEAADQSTLTKAGEQLLQKRESALVRLRKLSAEIAARSDAGRDETVIEFSNSAGTRKTPILVEVTNAGFRIQPAEVQVTEGDMLGFPASDNPLLAVLFAINDHRNPNQLHRQPYVLLLVRPGGSLPFYAAQRTLNEAGVHFGYELLSDERIIRFDKPSPEERQVGRQALLTALKRRKDVYGVDVARLDELRQKAQRQRMDREPVRRSARLPDDILRKRFSASAVTPPPVSSLVGQWERPEFPPADERAVGKIDDAKVAATEAEDDSSAAADHGGNAVAGRTDDDDPFPPLVAEHRPAWPQQQDAATADFNSSSGYDNTSSFNQTADAPTAWGPHSATPGLAATNGESSSAGSFETFEQQAQQSADSGDFDEAEFFGVPSHLAQGRGPKQSSRESAGHHNRTTSPDSDRTRPQADFGRPDRSSAETHRGTRTPESAEDRGAVFESSLVQHGADGQSVSGTTAGPTGGATASSEASAIGGQPGSGPAQSNAQAGTSASAGPPPASTSQDFLSRFMRDVEREQEKRRPNPVLLALLRHAEADENAADENLMQQHKGSERAVTVTLTAQSFQVADGQPVDLDQKTIDDLVTSILEPLQTLPEAARRQVRFRVSRSMLPIQQRLSKELARHAVATASVDLLNAATKSGQSVMEVQQQPAKPRAAATPRRSDRGVSL